MEDWFIPNTAATLPLARSVLVVAPHPDDEVFGCGGGAALYARAGASVVPFILTDGGGYLAGDQRRATVETRRAESVKAAQLLGTQAPVFGHWADRHLSSAGDLVERLAEIIESTGAEIVFAPSLWEVHPDHRAAAWATVMALRRRAEAGAAVPVLAFYEVGAPLRPTHLVNISAVLDAKKQAMACFESQLVQQRYDVHIAALNTFRTYTLPACTAAAEALAIVLPAQLQAFADSYGENVAHGLSMVTETALQRADESVELLQSRVNGQVQAIASLNAALAELAGTVDQQATEASALLDRLSQRQHELAELQASLRQVLNSHSWRVTWPLRWLAERLR
jgi:LmbE family N-acetylglucosaminyl deacetylase/uncharacterized coiled-coil protein SlyX